MPLPIFNVRGVLSILSYLRASPSLSFPYLPHQIIAKVFEIVLEISSSGFFIFVPKLTEHLIAAN